MIIDRKVVVELRGLPLHAWSEGNLKIIIRACGSSGWWINRPDILRRLKVARNCLFSKLHIKVSIEKLVKVKRVG